MKTSRSLSACLLALVALPVVGFSKDVKKATPAPAEVAKEQFIDAVKFKNATYGEVIDFLRVKSGENIVLAPELQNEVAPDIELRHVTVEGALNAIFNQVIGMSLQYMRDDDKPIWSVVVEDPYLYPRSKNKICRVFKASAKEKLAAPQLEQLLANITDVARKICEVNAKAQGHPAAEAPVIEAHAGTGILIVAGTESDVQLVGQVIQALGGEVVPLTSSVMTLTLDGDRIVAKDTEGTRQPIEVRGGNLTIDSTKAKDGTVPEFEGHISGSSPITSVEDAQKLLERARDKVKTLEKQLEQLSKQPQPKPAPPPAPPTAK